MEKAGIQNAKEKKKISPVTTHRPDTASPVISLISGSFLSLLSRFFVADDVERHNAVRGGEENDAGGAWRGGRRLAQHGKLLGSRHGG